MFNETYKLSNDVEIPKLALGLPSLLVPVYSLQSFFVI